MFKARLQKDPDSSCAFMAAAVIDQLLPGTTVRTGGQQLDVIVDAAAAEIASRNTTSEGDSGAPFWVPAPVAIKDEATGATGRTRMITTAMGPDSRFLRLIDLAPAVSADYIELLDAARVLRRASFVFDLTRSNQDSRGFVRSLY